MNNSFYQSMFDNSPVSIWVEDFTEVQKYVDKLKQEGITDLRAYYATYPDRFPECVSKLRIIDVNNTTLKLYKASTKEELFQNFATIFGQESFDCMVESVVAIAEGKSSFESQGINYDIHGNKLYMRITWNVPEADSLDYSCVMVAIQDMTRLFNIQSELEEREALFRCIFEQSSEGMLLIENSGKAILVNNAFCEMTGLSVSDVVGANIKDIKNEFLAEIKSIDGKDMEPEDLVDIITAFKTNRYAQEYRFYDDRHKLHAFRQSIIPIVTKSETIYAVILTDVSASSKSQILAKVMHQISHAVNVTESLEDLFKIIHEEISLLLDVTNIYIALYDRKSNLITFPYLVDTLNEDSSPVEIDNTNSLTAQVITEGQTMLLTEQDIIERIGYNNQIGNPSKNWLGVPLILNNEVIGAIVVQSYEREDFYDEDDKVLLESISEQIAFALHKKQSDESLAVLIQAIEQAGEGIIIFTPEGFIRYVNTLFERMTGYKKTELLEKPLEFLPFEQDCRKEMEQTWLRVRSSQPWHGKIDMIRKDGTKITLDMVVKPVIDQYGRLSSIIAGCKDITYEIVREEQLKRTQRLEAIGRLTGGIAHDFNNVLSAIIGYTELASDDIPADSDCAQNLNEVLKSATRAKEMIQHLISFSRQEESKTEIIDLVEHVRESVRFLRSYLPRSITIKERYNSTNNSIVAVPGQIHQILINLGTNSMHAIQHDHGIIEIMVDAVAFSSKDMVYFPELEQCQYLKITVTDNGCGIDEALIEHIFDPYFTTKSANEGTGLGLSIVHSIVHAHHGAIRVESTLGKGTKFTVLLPLYSADKWYPQYNEPTDDSALSGTENVMFIDDEPMLVNVFRQGLMKLGYKVEGFTDPRRAYEFFAKNYADIDLVVTDTTMPFMNGIDLSEKLMAIKPNIPIILCTGFTTLISAEEASRRGIKDFVMKPYKTKDIALRIRELLNENQIL